MRTNFGRTPENSQKLTTTKQMPNEERDHLKTVKFLLAFALSAPQSAMVWWTAVPFPVQDLVWPLLQQQSRPHSQVIVFSWSKVSGSFQRTDTRYSPLFCLTQNSPRVGKQKTVTKSIIRWWNLASPGAKITAETHHELPEAWRESWREFL